MKVAVIGTRGFPDIQGGVETHCQELYTRMAKNNDIEFIVYRRAQYLRECSYDARYDKIRFKDFNVPKNKYFETFVHSLLSTVHAFFLKPDIVHFHNSGPGFFIPLMKLRGIKTVFTYHNISYIQKKWNFIARVFLRLSEAISLKFSDAVIFISKPVQQDVTERFTLPMQFLIYNGVTIPIRSKEASYIEFLGLEKEKYIISVGRLTEEKGFDYLIKAFQNAKLDDYKLVLVGDADYPTTYSTKLKEYAIHHNVVLTGHITGEKLNQIYSHAKLFVLCSYTEGLSIVLLEALSHGLDVLVSDIPANKQLMLSEKEFFKVGNIEDLALKLKGKVIKCDKSDYLPILKQHFDWEKSSQETFRVFTQVIQQIKPRRV